MSNTNQNHGQPWNDFNTADSQEYDLIPTGTIAPVRMTIKPGGYDDLSQNWDGGYATCNQATGSVYLSCEFIVLGGEFAKRKVWGLIGLHSAKGATWQNMGRSFIRGLLNSAYGLSDKDDSVQTQQKRRIGQLRELDGICFVAKIAVKKDDQGDEKNQIKCALTPDHREYQTNAAYFLQQPTAVVSGATPTTGAVAQPVRQPQAPMVNNTSPVPPNRPNWANP